MKVVVLPGPVTSNFSITRLPAPELLQSARSPVALVLP